jgi:branched-chain amino acid transport system ATP-binding protein
VEFTLSQSTVNKFKKGIFMLQIKDLDVFYGHAQALHGINVQVPKGQITALVGANGAGKSTLMRCISGLVKNSRGSILLENNPIHNLRPHQIVRRGLIQVPEGRKLFPSLTVQENLEMGSMHPEAKKKRAETMEYVYNLLPRLSERSKQITGTLSGGEQQMVAFGRALMSLPRVLIMDEPSIGLAPLVVKEMYETVKKLNDSGATIFLIEQNLRASLKLAHRGYVIENGRIVIRGTSKELLSDERTVKAYFGSNKKS